MIPGIVLFNSDHLSEVAAQGFHIARIDLQTADWSLIQLRITDITAAGLRPLLILRDVAQIDAVAEGLDIELGNEPDLEHEGWTPESYRTRCEQFIDASRGRHRLWFGAVSNLNNRGFMFLEQLPWAAWGPDINCSVHRYPESHWPHEGHDRYTRDEEVGRLKEIVGERPIGLSEIGYRWTDVSEAELAGNMAWEREFFGLHGFHFAVAYQIGTSRADKYGFRRLNGTWRPVTEAWTR